MADKAFCQRCSKSTIHKGVTCLSCLDRMGVKLKTKKSTTKKTATKPKKFCKTCSSELPKGKRSYCGDICQRKYRTKMNKHKPTAQKVQVPPKPKPKKAPKKKRQLGKKIISGAKKANKAMDKGLKTASKIWGY